MDNLELEVINILRELGIPAHIKGYRYIIAAVKYLRKNPNSIYHVIKELYPEAGKSCGEEKTNRVERGIRHAISLASSDDNTWLKVLGRVGPMPNGEFLAALDETIRIKAASNPDKLEERIREE